MRLGKELPIRFLSLQDAFAGGVCGKVYQPAAAKKQLAPKSWRRGLLGRAVLVGAGYCARKHQLDCVRRRKRGTHGLAPVVRVMLARWSSASTAAAKAPPPCTVRQRRGVPSLKQRAMMRLNLTRRQLPSNLYRCARPPAAGRAAPQARVRARRRARACVEAPTRRSARNTCRAAGGGAARRDNG